MVGDIGFPTVRSYAEHLQGKADYWYEEYQELGQILSACRDELAAAKAREADLMSACAKENQLAADWQAKYLAERQAREETEQAWNETSVVLASEVLLRESAEARVKEREAGAAALTERTAQLLAHRACLGVEHDPVNGKLHGYCVVCGVPWPCEIAALAKKEQPHD